jgi:branched-chain amino acid transport system substrate-binding protein
MLTKWTGPEESWRKLVKSMRRARPSLAVLASCAFLAVSPQLAHAGDAIALGAAVSQTGKHALNGDIAKKGYDLAVKTINEKGGVGVGDKRYKLEITYYDDESMPARGMELAERLIVKDGVDFLLGPYSSSQIKAMLPIVEKHGVPMVEANGVARELFGKGYRHIFAVSAAGDYLDPAFDLAAANAGKLGKEASSMTLALAVDEDPYSRDVRAGVLGDAGEHGMRVVIDDELPPELNDMSVTLAKVKALKPDILVVSGHERGAITAVTQIEAMRIEVPILILTHCDSARLAETLPAASEGVFCMSQWHASLDGTDEWFGSAAEFARLYRETYGEEASSQAAQSAAAVLVFADAFARAQSLEPKRVRDALAATERDTFFGRVDFDDTGRNMAKLTLVTQLRDGKYVVVGPKFFAKGEPVIPRRP